MDLRSPITTVIPYAAGEVLAVLANTSEELTGNTCEVLEYDQSELRALIESDDSLIASLRADAISVSGTPARALLAEDR